MAYRSGLRKLTQMLFPQCSNFIWFFGCFWITNTHSIIVIKLCDVSILLKKLDTQTMPNNCVGLAQKTNLYKQTCRYLLSHSTLLPRRRHRHRRRRRRRRRRRTKQQKRQRLQKKHRRHRARLLKFTSEQSEQKLDYSEHIVVADNIK